MNLVLEVVGHGAPALGAERRKVFDAGGGSIGRAPECDWVLASPYISRHHATVCCINGVFYIESTGENGVAVNGPQSMLPQLERRALQSGDRLFIDEFEINVAVSGTHAAESQDDLSDESSDVERNELVGDHSNAIEQLPVSGDESLDPLKNLSARAAASSTTSPREDSPWNHSSSLADHFTPPPVAAAEPSALPISEDWNMTDFTRVPKRAPQELESTAADSSRGHTLIPASAALPADASLPPGRASSLFAGAASVVNAAGAANAARADAPGAASAAQAESVSAPIAATSFAPDEQATMNAVVRNIVQGLIDVMRDRAEFRNEFRLPVTRARTAENNPLKFAINADDALDSLMSGHNPGFMPAAEAFDDAFEDIRAHQLAMLAGMRAGFECVMSRFDPQKLQERFDRQLKHSGFLAVASKMRYWDLYADWFEELAADGNGAFQRLFGEEFANAYEKQLDTLKRNRGTPRH